MQATSEQWSWLCTVAHKHAFCVETAVQQVTLTWQDVSVCCQAESLIKCMFILPVLDPVPGACNIEFNLDIDPNVYLHYNLYETTIRFAPANIGYER